MANQGLITLQTDLKSLKYASMPLGSDKPYVVKDIGQAPGSQIGAEISHRIDDVSRIAKMLVDKPGIKYLLHEALLQQVNVADKIKKAQQGGKSLVGAVLKQAGSTLIGTAKIAASTLAQVPVNGTGTHFLRGFRTDTYLQPKGPGNISAFASFFGAGGIEGAQYALRGEVVPGEHKTEFLSDSRDEDSPYSYEGPVRADYNEVPNLKQPYSSVVLKEPKIQAEQGVPIQVAPKKYKGSDNLPLRETTKKRDSLFGSMDNQWDTIGQSEYVSITGDTPKISGNKGSDEPFDEEVPTEYTYLVQKQNFRTKNNNVTKEARVLLGDQGARNDVYKKINSYWTTSPDESEIDKLNALMPQTAKKVGDSGKVDGEKEGRDLIKFRFHIITPDQPETVLYFRAYLDTFVDNYSGQWSPVKYLGRAEDFQIYSGFQRKITLSFKIAAATRAEMEPIYQKMIWLASATAPTYASGGQFMRGTITKLTVGDYVYELAGVLNSVNYTWNVDYPWEIAMLEPENTGQDDFEQELPMVMDCQIDFTPIHKFTPTTGLKEYITTRLTERNKRGIKDIDNPKTGIQPVPEIEPAAAAAAPAPTKPVLPPNFGKVFARDYNAAAGTPTAFPPPTKTSETIEIPAGTKTVTTEETDEGTVTTTRIEKSFAPGDQSPEAQAIRERLNTAIQKRAGL